MKTERETELEDLLTSACAIAERKGEDVAWERFEKRLRQVGIGSVTAKPFRILPSDKLDTTITLVNMAYTVFQNEEVEATGISISWDSDAKGFGELVIMANGNGQVQIDTESMGKEFFMDLMSKLYDQAEKK